MLSPGFFLLATLLSLALAPAAQAEPFGLKTFANRTTDTNEAPYTLAGGHPDQNVTAFRVFYGERLNGTYINLPPGLIGNPAAAPRCPISKIPSEGAPDTDCPPGSQVGEALVTVSESGDENGESTALHPLYNVPPERGYPAQFAFKARNTPSVISVFPRPRTESYDLTVATPNIPAVGARAAVIRFFGIPSQHGSGNSEAPFLSNPLDCSEAEPTWSIAVDSQEHTGALRELGVPDLSDPDWKTASEAGPPVSGCDRPALASQFDPSLAVEPLQGGGPLQADQPAGLAVDLDFPQSNDPTDPMNTTFDPNSPQAPAPKDITVKLPAGLAISPSSADGLGGCSDLASDSAGDQVHYDNTRPVSCPDSARIGTALATSPLLATHDPVTDEVNGAEPIPGDVYLLKPHPGDLPIGGGNQDGKFRLLIQLENPRYGINFKLPGIATADPNTGQLTTVFTDDPQLPARHVTVNLKTGPRAPLATPVICGTFTATSNFVPWSTPGTPNATPSAGFSVASGPNGGGCPASPAARRFSPTLISGARSATAGASSPFFLRLRRQDGEGELSSLNLTTPRGFAASLKGVPYCPEPAIAAASVRSGAAERSGSSCSAASRVGSVTVGAGPGVNPYQVTGRTYLAGPYKGAPLSLAFIVPALAGPFDLGTILLRAALYIDPETAQIRLYSDPFPRILDGMPLRLRSIDVDFNRPGFTLNPTSCSPMAVNAAIGGSGGATATASRGFQAARCEKLGFRPKLALALLGPTRRSAHPQLRVTLTPRAGDANIARAAVTLPRTELLESAHIRSVCSRRQFDAGSCPRGSVYGRAEVLTPLLDEPLRGPVYLRNNPARRLPDLVASLDGQIHLDLVGYLDSSRGRIRASFDPPDLPLGRFALALAGGDRGLVVNTGGLCGASPPRALAGFTAQSDATHSASPLVRTDCARRHSGSS